MKVFITGATGYIGSKLALELANQGHQVVALVRSPKKATLIKHDNISTVAGDLFTLEAIQQGMAGCDQVYHVAGFARVWAKKPDTFHQINVVGTKNILEAAKANGIKKVVVTSTAGTLGPSHGDQMVTAESRPSTFFNEYESTKAETEAVCRQFAKEGLDTVIVNPTRVYGPGLMTESNAGTLMMAKYLEGKWKFLPGDGSKIGNYVFVEDVVRGHLLAMEKGKSGHNYVLGGTNASFNDYFDLLKRISDTNHRLFKLPVPLMFLFSRIQMLMPLFGREPLITPKWIRRFNYDWVVSVDKTETELGLTPTTLENGMKITVDWLAKNN